MGFGGPLLSGSPGPCPICPVGNQSLCTPIKRKISRTRNQLKSLPSYGDNLSIKLNSDSQWKTIYLRFVDKIIPLYNLAGFSLFFHTCLIVEMNEVANKVQANYVCCRLLEFISISRTLPQRLKFNPWSWTFSAL